MLHWILHITGFSASPVGRIVPAFLTSGITALLVGPPIIQWLQVNGVGERTDKTPIEDSELRNRINEKAGTPTMGGLIIFVGLLAGCLLWGDLGNGQLGLALMCFGVMATLGFVDDWKKLTEDQSNGIKVRYKLLVQMCLGGIIGGLVILTQPDWWTSWNSLLPWLPAYITGIALILWCGLVVATMSNAVNVSDGLDGLAAGLTLIALIPLGWILFQHKQMMPATSGELLIYVAAMTGSVAGFLYHNWHPARIFMGDTGSLALGSGIGLIALLSGVEVALPIVALVLLLELASSVLQVVWFQTTGRRILPISPLHHIWQQRSIPEKHIVAGFLLTGIVIICLCTPLF